MEQRVQQQKGLQQQQRNKERLLQALMKSEEQLKSLNGTKTLLRMILLCTVP